MVTNSDGLGETLQIDGDADNACQHSSGVVNGHYSGAPDASSNVNWNSGHGSHGSHGQW